MALKKKDNVLIKNICEEIRNNAGRTIFPRNHKKSIIEKYNELIEDMETDVGSALKKIGDKMGEEYVSKRGLPGVLHMASSPEIHEICMSKKIRMKIVTIEKSRPIYYMTE